jgi:hypothetical protein
MTTYFYLGPSGHDLATLECLNFDGRHININSTVVRRLDDSTRKIFFIS